MDCWLCRKEGVRANRRGRATCRRTEGAREGGWLWREEEVGAEGAAGSLRQGERAAPLYLPGCALGCRQEGRVHCTGPTS